MKIIVTNLKNVNGENNVKKLLKILFVVHTCVTPTRTSRLTLELPLIISPVPFKNPTPPRRNPTINIPRASSRDTNLKPFN